MINSVMHQWNTRGDDHVGKINILIDIFDDMIRLKNIMDAKNNFETLEYFFY